jgi:hypothetical protein
MHDFLEIQKTELLREVVQEVVMLESQGSEQILEIPTEHLLLELAPGDMMLEQVETLVLLEVGIQGPPGPPGIPGPAAGQALQRTAAETLSALRVVYELTDGRVALADAVIDAHVFVLLGVTLTAADMGQPVIVQRAGQMDDTGWTWVPGQRVYLGQGGALVQQPPAAGFDVLIGVALSATRLLLNLQDPIQLE